MIAHQQAKEKVVTLRSGIVFAMSAVLIAIVLLIIFNLTNTIDRIHHQNNEESNEKINIATEMDTSWYQHEKINLPPLESKQITVSPLEKNEINPKTITPSQPISTQLDQSISSFNKELMEAMKAPITSNQLTDQSFRGEISNVHAPDNVNGLSHSESVRNDPNMQNEKSLFIEKNSMAQDEYLHSTLHPPMSAYELQAGSIIPGILITGINSDLPGTITGQVKSNVYDSISGKYLLIPQGAKLWGEYDSKIAYGQKRVLVVWKRIIYPNGYSLNLEGMSGVDLSGYAGFRDQVDNHYARLFGSVLLMSVLTSGAQLSQPQQSNNPFAGPSVGQTLAQSLGTNIANVGTSVVSKDLNIQPTIEIRQGYEFNIEVKKDIVFAGPYET